HIARNPGIPLEVLINKSFGLRDRKLGPLRKTVARNAVDDPEVHRLSRLTLLAGDIMLSTPKDLGCCFCMDVSTRSKSLDEPVILRNMGENSQLNLGVIRFDQTPTLLREEKAADLPPLLGPNGNVLQIGVCTG